MKRNTTNLLTREEAITLLDTINYKTELLETWNRNLILNMERLKTMHQFTSISLLSEEERNKTIKEVLENNTGFVERNNIAKKELINIKDKIRNQYNLE
jgi:hypothetical protein